MKLKLLLLIVAIGALKVEGAQILFIDYAPSLSHQLFERPIIRELCSRGHKVVSVTSGPIDQNIENLKEIDIHNETYGAFNFGNFLVYSLKAKPRSSVVSQQIERFAVKLIEIVLTHPEFKALHNDKFDVIIMGWFYPKILHGLKDHFKCPLIGIVSTDIMLLGADALGNPAFPSYYVDVAKPSGRDLSFYQRLENFAFAMDMRWWFYSQGMHLGNELYKKVYNQDIDMKKMASNLDLLLVNYNPIFHLPKPMVPAIIPIGGIHERNRNPLPKVSKL